MQKAAVETDGDRAKEECDERRAPGREVALQPPYQGDVVQFDVPVFLQQGMGSLPGASAKSSL